MSMALNDHRPTTLGLNDGEPPVCSGCSTYINHGLVFWPCADAIELGVRNSDKQYNQVSALVAWWTAHGLSEEDAITVALLESGT